MLILVDIIAAIIMESIMPVELTVGITFSLAMTLMIKPKLGNYLTRVPA